VVAGVGGIAYIPFKQRTTGRRSDFGALWNAVWHYYMANREFCSITTNGPIGRLGQTNNGSVCMLIRSDSQDVAGGAGDGSRD
jgi:hypothetical protein